MSQVRINKYLSLCGVTSRRGAESMIEEGRVTLNDVTVEKVGTIIDEDTDTVKVDGTEARPVSEKIYIVLNKPRNVMTTLHDPFGRRTIRNYLKNLDHRVYPVGRLDYDTTGVLILTNDGDLAYRLAHPRYRVEKIYEAKVLGKFDLKEKEKIEKGIKLDDGFVGRAKIIILGYEKNLTRIRLIMTEGRKREVKQLCKKVGNPVYNLKRVEFAGVNVRNMKIGQYRYLTTTEIIRLKKMVGLKID